MPSVADLQPLLKREITAFYLIPVTYAYLYYLFGSLNLPYVGEVSMLWLTVVSLLAASYMYNEAEARQNYEEARREVSPWMYFETGFVIVFILTLVLNSYAFVFVIEWRGDIWLGILGFLNLLYGARWITDKVYGYKFGKHYVPEIRANRDSDTSPEDEDGSDSDPHSGDQDAATSVGD